MAFPMQMQFSIDSTLYSSLPMPSGILSAAAAGALHSCVFFMSRLHRHRATGNINTARKKWILFAAGVISLKIVSSLFQMLYVRMGERI